MSEFGNSGADEKDGAAAVPHPSPMVNDDSSSHSALWPLILMAAYLITLLIGAFGEIFEIPGIMKFILYR